MSLKLCHSAAGYSGWWFSQYVQVIEKLQSSPIHPTPGFLGSRTWQSHQNRKNEQSRNLLQTRSCCCWSAAERGPLSPDLWTSLSYQVHHHINPQHHQTGPDTLPSPQTEEIQIRWNRMELCSPRCSCSCCSRSKTTPQRNPPPFKPGLLPP